MGKLIVVSGMSVDGFYEGPGHDVTALELDAPFYKYNLERIKAAKAVLLGGKSYEGFASFWPQKARDSSAASHDQDFAAIYNDIAKMVVSDHAAPPQPEHPWAGTTTIVPRAHGHDAVRRLKAGDGEVVMWGSRVLWQDLMAQGLVDELHLYVVARVLGSGTRTFDAPASLRRIASRAFGGSDSALLCYEVSVAGA